MSRSRFLLPLVAIAVILTAIPAHAVQPIRSSYALIPADGFEMDCFDFNKGPDVLGLPIGGRAKSYFNVRSGPMAAAAVDNDALGALGAVVGFYNKSGKPQGDSVYAGSMNNVFFYGLPITRVEYHGTCETQGGAAWGYGGDFSSSSCSMTLFHRIAGIGNFNDSWSMIRVGSSFGKCSGLFARAEGAAAKAGNRFD